MLKSYNIGLDIVLDWCQFSSNNKSHISVDRIWTVQCIKQLAIFFLIYCMFIHVKKKSVFADTSTSPFLNRSHRFCLSAVAKPYWAPLYDLCPIT